MATILASPSYNGSISYNTYADPVQSQSPDLPEMIVRTADEHGKAVVMTLKPESNISNGELVKLMMLITAMSIDPSKFNTFAHVKKNNLERHFTYS